MMVDEMGDFFYQMLMTRQILLKEQPSRMNYRKK
jgi:hypothetical protein